MAILALVACKDKAPQTPKVSQVFPNLPLPPNASVVSKSGGTDALQITVMSPVRAKDVETYYRDVLSKNGWRLTNDMRDQDGAVVLFAEQDGPPLWVRIKSTDDSAATIVELAGAVFADSAKRVKPAS
ncbi:MAG: hypothetical protein ACREM9_09920 [Gemmatimonadales bacterium]